MSELITHELTICLFSHENHIMSTIKIIEKVINIPKKLVWFIQKDDIIKEMDDKLWTYSQLSFLPHAIDLDPFHEQQPIIITNNPSKFSKSHQILLITECWLNSYNQLLWQDFMIEYEKIIIILLDSSKISAKKKLDNLFSEYNNKVNKILLTYFDNNQNKWNKETISG
ncbi:DNA polymerase III subunit chi [Lyticum sinuosum]|uniref:DNA polymerase III subunit chi n=1 Tax=Lyticum sinuosum TaxID=1332059 RepID=A0AAE5AHE1_9RICK|nr:DNA polymerase III subunit chi [Lyticum sinuosum]MDZ5760906.1 DNA polymerase III subunit chi [Lyticum sinuosum]